MGRNAGIGITIFTAARVSGPMTYTPAYVKADGTQVNQRIKIPVGINGLKGKSGVAPVSFFTLVAWGKLADFIAKSMTKGRAFDAVCEPHSFQSRYFQNNVPLVKNDGTPLMIDRTGFTIRQFRIGEEANDLINAEIAAGRRPRFWNQKNTPDAVMWASILNQRNATVYQHGMQTFGYAKVVLPNVATPTPGQFVGQPAPGSMVYGGQPIPGSVYTGQPVPGAGLPGQVHQVLNGGMPQPQPGVDIFGNGGFVANAAPGAMVNNQAGKAPIF